MRVKPPDRARTGTPTPHCTTTAIPTATGSSRRLLSHFRKHSYSSLQATELKFKPGLPAGLTQDHLAALVACTHDTQTGKREGNLYFELNGMLRERGPSPLAPAGLD